MKNAEIKANMLNEVEDYEPHTTSELTCNKCGNNNWYMTAYSAGFAGVYCNKCKKLIKLVDRNERDEILMKLMEKNGTQESEDKECESNI